MELDKEFIVEVFWIAIAGIPTTLKLTFISLLFASPFALAIALIKLKKVKVWSQVVTVYVSFIRGTPLVVQILLVYSLLPSVLNVLFNKLSLPGNVFDINPIVYAYSVFVLNSIATLSEVFRSALSTVPAGQAEAAYSTGMNAFQAYRRIVIPQARTVALPSVCNVTVGLLKGTSLAFMMTVKDITALAKMEAAYGYNYIEAYIVIFFIYIILCSTVQLAFKLLERSSRRYQDRGEIRVC